MFKGFFVHYRECWKLHALIIISIYSTSEVKALVPGGSKYDTTKVNLARVAYLRT